MKKLIPFCLIAILLTASCQTVVDPDNLLDTDERILITGFLSPQDTVLRVNVTRALPSIGTPFLRNNNEAKEAKFLIEDAIVYISNEIGYTTTLSYSEENKTYLADTSTLAIIPEQNYFLNVIVNDKQFTASCTIPKKVVEINETVNIRNGQYGGKTADINLSFGDIAEQRNYYALGGTVTITREFEDQEPQINTNNLNCGTDELLSDSLDDGIILNGNCLVNVFDIPEDVSYKMTLQVANVEEILFQHLRTASTNNDIDSGNPFIEYAISPNNINEEGGTGIFAGYQLTEKTIDIAF